MREPRGGWNVPWGHPGQFSRAPGCFQLAASVLDERARKSVHLLFKNGVQGFPGGAVVKNLPCNAWDTGSIPGLERSHNAVGHLNWCTTTEPALKSPNPQPTSTKTKCCNY